MIWLVYAQSGPLEYADLDAIAAKDMKKSVRILKNDARLTRVAAEN